MRAQAGGSAPWFDFPEERFTGAEIMPVPARRCLLGDAWPVYLLAQSVDIQRFDAFPRPGRAAQEFEAGCNARVVGEAADVDDLSQRGPTVVVDQIGEDHFQRHAVERIVGLRCIHDFFSHASLCSEAQTETPMITATSASEKPTGIL